MSDHPISATMRAVDNLSDKYGGRRLRAPDVMARVGLAPERVRELLTGTKGCSPSNTNHRNVRMKNELVTQQPAEPWVEIRNNLRAVDYDARYSCGQLRLPLAAAASIGLVRGGRAKVYYRAKTPRQIKVESVDSGGMSVIGDAGHLRLQSKSLGQVFGPKTVITFRHIGGGVFDQLNREVRT
jgi:hypothetical protein